MESTLISAHTWFLESYSQGPYGSLQIRLVEGIKGADRAPVEVAGQLMGHYFPVTIEPHSRCVIVSFQDVRGLFTFPEGYDTTDRKLALDDGRFVRKVHASAFRDFASETTTGIEDFRGEYTEWLVWTEEQVFQVLAGEPPVVSIDDRKPDTSIERGQTWSAS